MDNRILVIAPHPDDELLGCGGVIKKFSLRGDLVFILVMTRGRMGKYKESGIKRVRNEALRAHKLIGVCQTRFFDFPAPDLDTLPLSQIAEAISEVIHELQIDTLFLPHRGDIHHDHKVVFNAGLVAARPYGTNTVKRIFSYETLSETEWSAPTCDEYFIPTTFVDIADVFNYKLEAMRCYKTQLRDFPHPRSLKAIEVLANFRGSTVGFEYAEAFVAIRNIGI